MKDNVKIVLKSKQCEAGEHTLTKINVTKGTEADQIAHILAGTLAHIVKQYDLVDGKKDFQTIMGKYYEQAE